MKDSFKVHNGEYEVVGLYTGNKNKLKFKCKTHGIFEQIPSNHLLGRRCRNCAFEDIDTWYGSGENDQNANDICYLYNIELSNDSEIFCKVGISNDYITRINKYKLKGYSVKVLDILIDTRYNCWKIEQKLLNKQRRKNNMYTPSIYFGGYTECFKTS